MYLVYNVQDSPLHPQSNFYKSVLLSLSIELTLSMKGKSTYCSLPWKHVYIDNPTLSFSSSIPLCTKTR